MISRSFERPERTVNRASDARNRYKIRYTRTQNRPPSRQVNYHGRVSGTHRWPSPASSPWMRRYPQVGFSAARRSASRRSSADVDGRPGGRWGWVQCPTMRRRCQRNSVSGVTSHPARLDRGSAAAIAPSKLRSASVSSGRSTCRRSTASWWRNTMISRSFERPERTVNRASDARNRYKIRYTRTQNRPPSRQVNYHGRVSGTHRMQLGFGALFTAVTLWAFRDEAERELRRRVMRALPGRGDAAIYGGCIRTVAAPPSEARDPHRTGRFAPDPLCAAL